MKPPSWLIALAMCAGLSPAFAQAPVRVKLATLAPKGSSIHQVLQQMSEKWRQAPGGGLAVTFFTDGTMGGEADMVRKMRIGQIQAAALTAVGLSEIDRSAAALQFMPMVFKSSAEVEYVVDKLSARLEKAFEEKGFFVLCWSDAGWIHYFSKQPVTYPEDMKKLKIFAWAGGAQGVDLMKELGYQPVPLETADILPGLQTGLISAVPSIPIYANAGQLFNHAPYMLDLSWAPIVGGVVMTKKAWDQVPIAAQQKIRDAAREAGKEIGKRTRIENAEAVQAMVKRGLKVTPLTPEAEAAWRRTAESVYPRIRGKMVPADLFDEVLQLVQQFRAQSRTGP